MNMPDRIEYKKMLKPVLENWCRKRRSLHATIVSAILMAAGCGGKADRQTTPSSATPRAEKMIKDGRYYEAIRAWQTEPKGADTDQRIRETEKILAAEIDLRNRRAISLVKRGRLGEAARIYDECYRMDPRRDDMIPKSETVKSDLAKRKAELQKVLENRRTANDLEGTHETLLKLDYLDPFDSVVKGALEDSEKQWRRELDTALDGAMKLYRSRSFSEAAPQFNRIVRKWPGHAIAKNYLAQSRTDSTTLSTAKSDRERAEQAERARLATVVQNLIDQSDTCQKAGDYRCAIEKLNTALDEDPDSTLARDRREAILRELSPQTDEMYRRGLEHYRAEDLPKAIEQWRLLLLVNPEHERARRDLQRAEAVMKSFQRVPEAPKTAEPSKSGI